MNVKMDGETSGDATPFMQLPAGNFRAAAATGIYRSHKVEGGESFRSRALEGGARRGCMYRRWLIHIMDEGCTACKVV